MPGESKKCTDFFICQPVGPIYRTAAQASFFHRQHVLPACGRRVIFSLPVFSNPIRAVGWTSYGLRLHACTIREIFHFPHEEAADSGSRSIRVVVRSHFQRICDALRHIFPGSAIRGLERDVLRCPIRNPVRSILRTIERTVSYSEGCDYRTPCILMPYRALGGQTAV